MGAVERDLQLVERGDGPRREPVAAHLVAPVRTLLEHDTLAPARAARIAAAAPAGPPPITAMSQRSVTNRYSTWICFGDPLVMMDHLGDDEAQELLGEHRIEP